MRSYQKKFIEFLIQHQALQFGAFTLKSGRKSPYFFNSGVFYTGQSLLQLGKFYAATLETSGMHYDILFGPAYKGIPLVVTTAIALSEQYQKEVAYCFNRKETKQYGDGGAFVGAPLQGHVVMLDDVITAGTTVRDTIALLKNTEATLSGIIIAFDRQERGQGNVSAVQETVKTLGIPVQSIVTLSDVVQYLSTHQELKMHLQAIKQYHAQYGAILKIE